MRGKFIVIGDFNFPDIRWDAGSAGPKGRKFYEITMDKFLQQHVETETHTRGNILDLVLSSHDSLVSELSMEGKIGSSDHEMIQFRVNAKENRARDTTAYRDFGRANWPKMRQMMQRNWRELLRNKNVNEMWLQIKRVIDE